MFNLIKCINQMSSVESFFFCNFKVCPTVSTAQVLFWSCFWGRKHQWRSVPKSCISSGAARAPQVVSFMQLLLLLYIHPSIHPSCVTTNMIVVYIHRGSTTCITYGQTGAGKTHTMLGSSPDRPGLYTLAVWDIFYYRSGTQTHSPLLVFVSFFEIYCGQLYDLLNDKKRCLLLSVITFLPFLFPLIRENLSFILSIRLFAREDGQKVVHITGLHEVRVDSVGSLLQVCLWFQQKAQMHSNESFLLSPLLCSLIKAVSHGMAERTQGMSGANAHSSRSHTMLQLQLREPNQQMAGRWRRIYIIIIFELFCGFQKSFIAAI